MATLTWRNVDAPDFRGAQQGFRTAGDLLSNAATGWNNQIKALADQEKDASDLLSAAQRRDVTAEALNQTQYTNGRVRDADMRLDRANPAIQQALQLGRLDDQAGITKLLAENPDLAQLRPDQFQALLKGTNSETNNTLGNVGTRQSINTSAFDFGNKVQTKADNDAVNAGVADLIQNTGGAEDALPRVLSRSKNMSPAAQIAFATAANKLYPGVIGPIAPGSSGAIPTSAAPAIASAAGTGAPSVNSQGGNAYDTVLGFGKYGSPEKPVSAMTVGEALTFGETLKAKTKGDASLGLPPDKGSSALGAFQITGETLRDYGPKVLGANWQKEQLTPANQEKIAEAIFNDRKNGNLKSTWTSLPDATAGAYKDVTWSDMRRQIAKGEVGGTLGDAPTLATTDERRAAGFNLDATVGEQNNFSILPDVVTAQKSTESLREVATRMRAKGGDLEGWSEKKAMNAIQDAATKAGSNYAVGGALIRRSTEAPNAEPGFLANWIPSLTPEVRINKDALAQNISNYSGGAVDRSQVTVANTSEFRDTLVAAETKAKDARQKVKDYQKRVDNGQSELAVMLPALQAQANEAIRTHTELLRTMNTDPLKNPTRLEQEKNRKKIAENEKKQEEVQAKKPISMSEIFRLAINGPDR